MRLSLSFRSPHFRNATLKKLDADTIERLHLKAVDLPIERQIENPGDPIKHLSFIENGIGSMTHTFENGAQIEVGMFGWEAVIGVPALMGTKQSFNKIYMQSPGHGHRCRIEDAVKEFRRFGLSHDLALRYAQAQLIQTQQSAGCNATHTARQRLARWLLLSNDRIGSDVLPLTHEFLSEMLGTGRNTVSIAAEVLHKEGSIEFRRGKVNILDRAKLEKSACECYRVVKQYLDSYAEVEQGE